MRYVTFEQPGGPSVLRVAAIDAPEPGEGEIRIRVEAAGVSRADTLQRKGLYPPPPGASAILGMEAAGTVDAVGPGVTKWKAGDRVCAIVSGGAYAEELIVPEGLALPIPSGWTFVEAATLPENAFTVYDNVFTRARLQPGESILVHGGTSGIGTTAIMFAKAFGSIVYATAGSDEKCAACVRLGATNAINYRTHDFVDEIVRLTNKQGVNVVLDVVGGDYIARDLKCVALDGRIACIATARGTDVQFNLGMLLGKRASILGSSMRGRTVAQKAAVAQLLLLHVWPLLPAKDPIAPEVDAVFPFERAAEAHARLESSEHIGKIVLVPTT
ncbi:MAG TPA: NAD(P)H-quinone oxidoreductase [Candidatus Acidoferrales bacterium]|jgi:NADPH2:quinone reductase|nr:NAD(P)H-quinone oxidoreductase [Candidatus Acidoferrales bacterium]